MCSGGDACSLFFSQGADMGGVYKHCDRYIYPCVYGLVIAYALVYKGIDKYIYQYAQGYSGVSGI